MRLLLPRLRPLFLVLGLLAAPAARAEVRIERTFLPLDAAPSSFAIGLPGGVNFCFDPVRGGVSYAWRGDFVDVSPARPGPGKFINPVKLQGPVLYQESGVAPLRRGDPRRAPVVVFGGYALRDDTVEFRYTVDGVAVREEIGVGAGGGTLVRRFQIAGAADARWWHVVEGRPAAELKRETGGTLVLELPLGKAAP